jgi:hypothetical protein
VIEALPILQLTKRVSLEVEGTQRRRRKVVIKRAKVVGLEGERKLDDSDSLLQCKGVRGEGKKATDW